MNIRKTYKLSEYRQDTFLGNTYILTNMFVFFRVNEEKPLCTKFLHSPWRRPTSVSCLHLFWIYCFTKKTSARIGCLWNVYIYNVYTQRQILPRLHCTYLKPLISFDLRMVQLYCFRGKCHCIDLHMRLTLVKRVTPIKDEINFGAGWRTTAWRKHHRRNKILLVLTTPWELRTWILWIR